MEKNQIISSFKYQCIYYKNFIAIQAITVNVYIAIFAYYTFFLYIHI